MTYLKELCMVLAACIHIRPYGNHGMCIQFVDFLCTLFHISVALLIQDLLAPISRIPGIPVLYHTVKRNPDLTVMAHDLKKLFCCIILFFGLHIAISPFWQQLRLTCKITVIMDDLVHASAAHEIIIDLIYCIQEQIRILKIIVKCHKRTAVYQDSISFCGNQNRHRNTHIVLIQILAVASVIINTFLCLSKSMDLLILFPCEEEFSAVCSSHFFSFQVLDKVSLTVNRLHTVDDRLLIPCVIMDHIGLGKLRFLLEKPLASICMLPGDITGCSVDLCPDFLSFHNDISCIFFCGKINLRIFFFLNDQRVLCLFDLFSGNDHANDLFCHRNHPVCQFSGFKLYIFICFNHNSPSPYLSVKSDIDIVLCCAFII